MKKIGFVLLFFAFSIMISHAVLPPEQYKKQASASKIKAVAIVKKIQVMSHHNGISHKKITFLLVKSFGKLTPARLFVGYCKSFEPKKNEKVEPVIGGTIYHYPNKDVKVFVTISKNKGRITTYTTLDTALESELMENGLKNIKYKMGTISIDR